MLQLKKSASIFPTDDILVHINLYFSITIPYPVHDTYMIVLFVLRCKETLGYMKNWYTLESFVIILSAGCKTVVAWCFAQ